MNKNASSYADRVLPLLLPILEGDGLQELGRMARVRLVTRVNGMSRSTGPANYWPSIGEKNFGDQRVISPLTSEAEAGELAREYVDKFVARRYRPARAPTVEREKFALIYVLYYVCARESRPLHKAALVEGFTGALGRVKDVPEIRAALGAGSATVGDRKVGWTGRRRNRSRSRQTGRGHTRALHGGLPTDSRRVPRRGDHLGGAFDLRRASSLGIVAPGQRSLQKAVRQKSAVDWPNRSRAGSHSRHSDSVEPAGVPDRSAVGRRQRHRLWSGGGSSLRLLLSASHKSAGVRSRGGRRGQFLRCGRAGGHCRGSRHGRNHTIHQAHAAGVRRSRFRRQTLPGER